jgi:hypothetical protein
VNGIIAGLVALREQFEQACEIAVERHTPRRHEDPRLKLTREQRWLKSGIPWCDAEQDE